MEIHGKSRVGQERGQDARRSRTNPGRMEKVRHNDGPNAQNGVWKGQEQYYQRNMLIHDKDACCHMTCLWNMWGSSSGHDARAHYRVRFCGGVVDGVKGRRGVRLMEHNGRFGGKHGSAIGSFWI